MVTKTKRKVTISRAKWLRGSMEPYMVDNKGCMCCLGFAANQISRITKRVMIGAGEPCDVYKKRSFLTIDGLDAWGSARVQNNQFADQAMDINDNAGLSEKMREYKLKRLFSKNGIELEFVD